MTATHRLVWHSLAWSKKRKKKTEITPLITPTLRPLNANKIVYVCGIDRKRKSKTKNKKKEQATPPTGSAHRIKIKDDSWRMDVSIAKAD